MSQIPENSFLILIIVSSISPGFLLIPDFRLSFVWLPLYWFRRTLKTSHLYRNILKKPTIFWSFLTSSVNNYSNESFSLVMNFFSISFSFSFKNISLFSIATWVFTVAVVIVELEAAAELDNFISVCTDIVAGDALSVFDLTKKPIWFFIGGGGAAFIKTYFSASLSSFQTLLVFAIKPSYPQKYLSCPSASYSKIFHT